MTTTVNVDGKSYTKESLSALPTSQLADLYNRVCELLEDGRTVNRFADKAVAVRRTWGQLISLKALNDTNKEEAKKATPKPKGERPKRQPKPRGMRFVFPLGDEIKPVREGTNRAKLVELLSRPEGASFEECQKATGWSKKDCYEGIRLLHYYVGYGLRQDDEKRIYLVAKK